MSGAYILYFKVFHTHYLKYSPHPFTNPPRHARPYIYHKLTPTNFLYPPLKVIFCGSKTCPQDLPLCTIRKKYLYLTPKIPSHTPPQKLNIICNATILWITFASITWKLKYCFNYDFLIRTTLTFCYYICGFLQYTFQTPPPADEQIKSICSAATIFWMWGLSVYQT